MFVFATSVKLHDTDSAGLLFFGHQFKIAHDAYEAWLDNIGLGFARIFQGRDFLIPIVHAEADYDAVLYVGDRLTVQLSAENIGDTSFTLTYELRKGDSQLAGKVRTVHVCVGKASGEKIPIPEDLRRALQILKDSDS